MTMAENNCLLLASRGAEAERIADFCRTAFTSVEAYHGDWRDPLPEGATQWSGNFVISYCSRWVVPPYLLKRAKVAAINFHPALPKYAGVGGINWAIYNRDELFGVTCHHMVPTVDAGPIIETRSFPILPSDTAESLYKRTHLHLETLALDIISLAALNKELPLSSIQWSGIRRTHKELNELSTINNDMSAEEVKRRIRATTFGPWRPVTIIGGMTFELTEAKS